MDIFKTLIKENIPFSVGVDVSRVRIESVEEVSKSYFIVISAKDKDKVNGFNFRTPVYNKKVSTVTLINSEIDLFKNKYFDLFLKKVHNKYGRIYELKSNSFKEYYNKIKH